jgi:hypothetical protein
MRMFVAAVLSVALLVGCAPPPPSISALPTVVPTPSTVAPQSLRPDGLAKVVPNEGLAVWREPSADRADRLDNPLSAGAVVYLTRGPQTFEGTAWWEVQADYVAGREETFGWVAGSDAAGAATLAAVAADCPGTEGPIDTAAIKTLGTLVSLACFGSRELEMRGMVQCSAATVSWIPFGVTVSSPIGPPDPDAVILCRQIFVVTSVTKID